MHIKSLAEQKAEWEAELRAMNENDLRNACNQHIWLSAYASNNPRSAYHWMCDATYDECKRRGKENIYSEEHEKLVKDARGY